MRRIACSRPSQPLKSPTTETPAAVGAQTANATPLHAVVVDGVRAQPLPQPLVPALAREVEVQLPERGQEAVRVAQGEDLPARVVTSSR